MKSKKRSILLISTVGLIYLVTMFFIHEPFSAWVRDSAKTRSKAISTFAQGHVYRQGDRGGYIWELQNRMKFLGFYTGSVNGIFTERTTKAVRLFQYEYGMKIDGLVGAKTKEKLWSATRNWKSNASSDQPVQSSHGFSQKEIDMMTKAVYGEARGEPYIGQVAVAAVILNRVESDQFPNTPSAVIFQPLAFTAVADGQIWLTPNETAKKATMDAINGWDPSSGALYYFNPVTATSKWIWNRPQIKKVGKHIFCR